MTATVHYLDGTGRPKRTACSTPRRSSTRTDAIAFCELAVSYLEANASDIDDPAPLVRLARRLGELTGRASTGPVTAHPSGQRGRPPSHRRGTR